MHASSFRFCKYTHITVIVKMVSILCLLEFIFKKTKELEYHFKMSSLNVGKAYARDSIEML